LDEFVSIRSEFDAASQAVSPSDEIDTPIHVFQPDQQSLPFVFASPHSGRYYPEDFVTASRLDPLRLRRSEDSFVDQLFSSAPSFGAPLLTARYPRAYVDPNREAYELDPAMFEDPLPDYVNTGSVRVSAGLGTVARVVTNGEEIYEHKLTFAEAKRRIDHVYTPYHTALRQLIGHTKAAFGICYLIDCHSMPSTGGPMEDDPGSQRVDVVLGNNHGNACAPELIQFVEEQFTDLGLTVRRNNPYSGGYTTRHYGQPQNGVHALQIELNRALYMDEICIEKHAGFDDLMGKITVFLSELSDFQST